MSIVIRRQTWLLSGYKYCNLSDSDSEFWILSNLAHWNMEQKNINTDEQEYWFGHQRGKQTWQYCNGNDWLVWWWEYDDDGAVRGWCGAQPPPLVSSCPPPPRHPPAHVISKNLQKSAEIQPPPLVSSCPLDPAQHHPAVWSARNQQKSAEITGNQRKSAEICGNQQKSVTTSQSANLVQDRQQDIQVARLPKCF